MGCLKLTDRENVDRPNFLSVWRKNAASESCDNYYPFGLTFNSYSRENSIKNRYLFNGGSERQDDLGINWDYTFYRTYDPAIGIFMQIDPKVDDFYEWTPYNYAYDDPAKNNDPNGDCPLCALAGAAIGAAVGGAIEAGTQLYEHGEVKDWGAVGGAALQGGITGGVAGLTGGASLLVTAGASAAANAVGGAVNNAVQGKEITVGTVAKDAAVGALAGAGGKLLNNLTNKVEGNIQSAANKAKEIVGSGKGPVYGSKVHSEFSKINVKGTTSEVSYKNGQVVPYGTKGSVRADKVAGNINKPTAVYDLKTGGAKLTPAEIKNYQQHVPGSPPVKQIKPN